MHQIEYAIGGVVEVETASAHYLSPPQQAAWIPVGLEHQATMNPDIRTVAVMFDRELVTRAFTQFCEETPSTYRKRRS